MRDCSFVWNRNRQDAIPPCYMRLDCERSLLLPGREALTTSSPGWVGSFHQYTQWSSTEETSTQSDDCRPPWQPFPRSPSQIQWAHHHSKPQCWDPASKEGSLHFSQPFMLLGSLILHPYGIHPASNVENGVSQLTSYQSTGFLNFTSTIHLLTTDHCLLLWCEKLKTWIPHCKASQLLQSRCWLQLEEQHRWLTWSQLSHQI